MSATPGFAVLTQLAQCSHSRPSRRVSVRGLREGERRRAFRALVAAVLAQGTLGAVQYALGVPEVLVSLHVLGACLVTAAAAALWASTTGSRTVTSRSTAGDHPGPRTRSRQAVGFSSP